MRVRAVRPARLLAFSIVAIALAVRAEEAAPIKRTAPPPDAKVYIISPAAGEVSNPITIRFGLTGMGVAPAGVAAPNTGHHHLILDAAAPPQNAAFPKDDHYRHFGGGQTEVTLDLPPGEHTLQLELADKDHVPFDPPLLSEVVKIRVKPPTPGSTAY